ncbi:unnamed protein product [Mytilus coruscus]|uniref:Uncharacterized protein n=1 Tax=Mytilus coruscus TaxID=42192 RepID=A0A6J8CKP9_MYTCO|nr:unnamed protein product [Mytilus coruscus]
MPGPPMPPPSFFINQSMMSTPSNQQMLCFPATAPAPPWVYHILMMLNNISNSLSGMSTEVKSLSVCVAKLGNSNDNVCRKCSNDLRCRGYIDNLLLHGIPEAEDDTSENCIDTVGRICEDKLKLNDVKHTITIAHRLGQKKAEQTRPIIVRFNYSKSRSKVRSNSYMLKNTNFGISQQYPKDVNDRRKRLVPMYKEAKLQKRKPFSLMIIFT